MKKKKIKRKETYGREQDEEEEGDPEPEVPGLPEVFWRFSLNDEAALGLAAAVEAVLVRGAGEGPVGSPYVGFVPSSGPGALEARARGRVVALERQTGHLLAPGPALLIIPDDEVSTPGCASEKI